MVAVEALMSARQWWPAEWWAAGFVIDGLTGYLVDSLNASALAAALAEFIRNPDLSSWMGSNAFLWSAKRFELKPLPVNTSTSMRH